MDRTQALSLLGRYVPSEEVDNLLDIYGTVQRVVGGTSQSLYDPYAAAYAYLVSQPRIRSWQAEDVREEYASDSDLLDWLVNQSSLLRAGWPLGDGAANLSLQLDIQGWAL